jgi:hypothetical protein
VLDTRHKVFRVKPQIRDNLIYLAVGISVAALVAADSFYSDSHGTKMWTPSRFSFRAATSSGLLTYFVVREMRRKKATVMQILASVLFATLVQLGIMFALREPINQLPGLTYSAIVVVELFFVWQLTVEVIPHLIGRRR